jgi:hypothetical protein
MQDAIFFSQILIGLGLFIWIVWICIPMFVGKETFDRMFGNYKSDPFGFKYLFGSFIIPLIVIMFGLLVGYRVI